MVAAARRKAVSIQVTLSPRTADRLASKASDCKKTVQRFAAEAIESYIDSDDDFVAAVHAGIAQLDAGQGIPHEQVEAWIKSLRSKKPLPLAKMTRR